MTIKLLLNYRGSGKQRQEQKHTNNLSTTNSSRVIYYIVKHDTHYVPSIINRICSKASCNNNNNKPGTKGLEQPHETDANYYHQKIINQT